MVRDGQELLDYLHRRGAYADPASSPRPGLILLDLHMPRMDGYDALEEIRSERALTDIPIVVRSSSKEAEDRACSFLGGANAYITKPVTSRQLERIVAAVEARQSEGT